MSKPSGKLARWALTIQEMDLTIKHEPGKANSNANALSRNISTVEVVSAAGPEVPSDPDVDNLGELQWADPSLVPMLQYLKEMVFSQKMSKQPERSSWGVSSMN